VYNLKRVGDDAGDRGGMSTLFWVEKGKVKYEHNSKPRIGVCIRVGSIITRSYQNQDWWQTTYITEILEDTENYVKFKTSNSIYEWKVQ